MFLLHRPSTVMLSISIEAGDMAYYVKVVTAKVAEMTPRAWSSWG
jgi:hypothetical protein